jgi:hypothetical protein
MKRGPFRIFLKQPGGWRILAGGILVFLLALATLTGSAWTPYSAGEMDIDHQLAPPSVHWLKRLMATDAALKAQERESGGSNRAPVASPGTDEEDLGYLKGGGEAVPPKRGGAASAIG